MYTEPAGELAFGDIFSAAWFFDAYLRRDAVPLVEFQVHGGARAWRRAAVSQDRDIVFAHGQQRNAILVADDCEIETIIRRRGRSRLTFAAVEQLPTNATEADRALATRAFRRFPLPPTEGFSGGVVEFQQLFAVSVDAVQRGEDGLDPRVLRLDREARLELEMRWNAFAVRRGPLTHLDNSEKFARMLTASGDADRLERLHAREEDPEEEHVALAKSLVAALNAAWELEGAVMNDVAAAYERGDTADASRAQLRDSFRELASRAQRAAAQLAQDDAGRQTEERPSS